MFDIPTTIFRAFLGAFQGNKDLRKGFWLFLFTVVFSWICLAYNAYMSLAEYEAKLGRLPYAEIVAILITSGMALTILFAMSYVCSYAIDLWRYAETEQSTVMTILTTLALIALVVWDININMQGVDTVSHNTTEAVIINEQEAKSTMYDSKIEDQQTIIDDVIKKYTYRGKVWFRPTKYHPLAEWQQDTATVNRAKRQIATYNELASAAAETALSDYKADKDRFNRDVKRKQITHKTIVKWIYALVLLLSLMIAFYVDEAQHYITHLQASNDDERKKGLWWKWSQKSANNKTKSRRKIGFGTTDSEEEASNKAPSDTHTPSGLNAAYYTHKRGKKTPSEIEINLPKITLPNFPKIRVNIGHKNGQDMTGNMGKNPSNFTHSPQKAAGKNDGKSMGKNEGKKMVNLPSINVSNIHTNLNPETPYNLGKKYDLSRSQKEKINKVRKAYLSYVKKHNDRPTITELSDRVGMNRKTVSKYVKMMTKEGQHLIK